MNEILQQLFGLKNQTAVVLGGSGVLGGAIAQALGEAGARVAIVGRNALNGNERVQYIQNAGGEASFVYGDALQRDSLETARDEIERAAVEHDSAISILVNAAGGNKPEATLSENRDFCDLPLESWRDVFDLNLVGGVLLPCQIFGEAMLQNGKGSIINVASLSGMTPLSRVVAYSAAKAAVLNLTQFLAREWAPRGVRVNALSPGFFPAAQNRALLQNVDGILSPRGQQIIAHTPMARFGEAHELASAALFLAGNGASFVTGQNIVVDGGFSSMTI